VLLYKPYPEDFPRRLEVMLDGTRLGTIYAPVGEGLYDERPCEYFTKGRRKTMKFPTIVDAKHHLEALVAEMQSIAGATRRHVD
jgi:hypothetical protein